MNRQTVMTESMVTTHLHLPVYSCDQSTDRAKAPLQQGKNAVVPWSHFLKELLVKGSRFLDGQQLLPVAATPRWRESNKRKVLAPLGENSDNIIANCDMNRKRKLLEPSNDCLQIKRAKIDFSKQCSVLIRKSSVRDFWLQYKCVSNRSFVKLFDVNKEIPQTREEAKDVSKDDYMQLLGLHSKAYEGSVNAPLGRSSRLRIYNSHHIPISSDYGRKLIEKERICLPQEVALRKLDRVEWYLKQSPSATGVNRTPYEVVYENKCNHESYYKFPRRQCYQRHRSLREAFQEYLLKPAHVRLEKIDVSAYLNKTKLKGDLTLNNSTEVNEINDVTVSNLPNRGKSTTAIVAVVDLTGKDVEISSSSNDCILIPEDLVAGVNNPKPFSRYNVNGYQNVIIKQGQDEQVVVKKLLDQAKQEFKIQDEDVQIVGDVIEDAKESQRIVEISDDETKTPAKRGRPLKLTLKKVEASNVTNTKSKIFVKVFKVKPKHTRKLTKSNKEISKITEESTASVLDVKTNERRSRSCTKNPNSSTKHDQKIDGLQKKRRSKSLGKTNANPRHENLLLLEDIIDVDNYKRNPIKKSKKFEKDSKFAYVKLCEQKPTEFVQTIDNLTKIKNQNDLVLERKKQKPAKEIKNTSTEANIINLIETETVKVTNTCKKGAQRKSFTSEPKTIVKVDKRTIAENNGIQDLKCSKLPGKEIVLTKRHKKLQQTEKLNVLKQVTRKESCTKKPSVKSEKEEKSVNVLQAVKPHLNKQKSSDRPSSEDVFFKGTKKGTNKVKLLNHATKGGLVKHVKTEKGVNFFLNRIKVKKESGQRSAALRNIYIKVEKMKYAFRNSKSTSAIQPLHKRKRKKSTDKHVAPVQTKVKSEGILDFMDKMTPPAEASEIQNYSCATISNKFHRKIKEGMPETSSTSNRSSKISSAASSKSLKSPLKHRNSVKIILNDLHKPRKRCSTI